MNPKPVSPPGCSGLRITSPVIKSAGRCEDEKFQLLQVSDAYDFRPQGEILAEKSALMPTRQIDSLEMRDVVRNALDDLGERQKTAVLLHKFEGMSYEEIGEIMGLALLL